MLNGSAVLLKVFDRVPMHAPFVLLSVGQQGHDNQSHYDASGYEVLHHACHSTGLAQWATTAQMMVTKGRGRQ
jgi:hypothetical protein